MGMILTQYFTHNSRTLPGGFVIIHPQFVHGKKDPSVYWFQTIPYIRQCPAYDYTHGVIDVGRLHLLLNVDGNYSVVVVGLFGEILFFHVYKSEAGLGKSIVNKFTFF